MTKMYLWWRRLAEVEGGWRKKYRQRDIENVRCGVEERTSNRVSEIVFNRERKEEILIKHRGYEQETRKRGGCFS